MKMPTLYIFGFTLAVISGPLIASDLTIPNSFSANTRAVASEVNANFTAVEAAVDDNDANINTNTANISTNTSNINTNTSNIGINTSNISGNTSSIGINASNINTNASNISTNASEITTNTSNIGINTSNINTNTSNISTNASEINANTANIAINASDIATLSTQVTSLETGYISAHAAALVFEDVNIACNTHLSVNFFNLTNGVNCGVTNGALLYIPLQLPHGLTVTGFSCGIYDTSVNGFVDRLTFFRQPINAGAYTPVSDLTANSDDSGYQVLSSGVLAHTVDNSNAGYGIRVILGNGGADFSTITTSLRFIGCTVSYQP